VNDDAAAPHDSTAGHLCPRHRSTTSGARCRRTRPRTKAAPGGSSRRAATRSPKGDDAPSAVGQGLRSASRARQQDMAVCVGVDVAFPWVCCRGEQRRPARNTHPESVKLAAAHVHWQIHNWKPKRVILQGASQALARVYSSVAEEVHGPFGFPVQGTTCMSQVSAIQTRS